MLLHYDIRSWPITATDVCDGTSASMAKADTVVVLLWADRRARYCASPIFLSNDANCDDSRACDDAEALAPGDY